MRVSEAVVASKRSSCQACEAKQDETTWQSLVLPVTLVLLIALALVVVGCGTDSTAYRSSSTSTTRVASAKSSSSASTSLPAAGSSISLKSTDVAVPAGKLLEVTALDPKGGVSEYFLLDPQASKGYREMASPCPTPGYDVMIFDSEGHRAMSGVTLEVSPDPPVGQKSANYEQIIGEDYLAGREATVTGSELYQGQETIVAEATVAGPEGPRFKLTVNIDPTIGLRLREQVEVELQVYVTERRLVDPRPELLAKLDKDSIRTMAAGFRSERKQELANLPYPARGFLDGTDGLSLLWIIPGLDWTSVRLEYQSPSTIGRPAVTVITYDLIADTKAAPLFTVPLEKAALLTEEGSDVLRFRDGDTGIQIQAAAGTSRDLALKLVVVGGPGSKQKGGTGVGVDSEDGVGTEPLWVSRRVGCLSAVSLAVRGQYNGLVNGVIGYGRTWSPWLPATRGEGARVLWNLLCIDLGPGYVAGNGVSVTGVVPLADPTTKGSGPHSYSIAYRPLLLWPEP